MRIAVASDDHQMVSEHFGRSACWTVFEVEDGEIRLHEIRRNEHTGHARGECHSEGGHDHSHSHATIVDALKDCDGILCGGMGWRAAVELEQNGIPPFVVGPSCSAEEAVRRHLAGESQPARNNACAGRHSH